MKRCFELAIIALLLPVAGCVSNKEIAERNGRNASADRAIICQAGADCEEKWARALEWIQMHSAYPVTTQSDTLIATDGPMGVFDDQFGFTVTKKLGFKKSPEPLPEGITPPLSAAAAVATPDNYNIVLFPRCDNWLGCMPSPAEVKIKFADFVIGSSPVPRPVLGVKVTPVTLDMAQKMHMPDVQGLAITAIVPNSLAAQAELSEGDIIAHYNETVVLTETALADLVGSATPGQHAVLDIIRGKKHQKVVITFPAAAPAATAK